MRAFALTHGGDSSTSLAERFRVPSTIVLPILGLLVGVAFVTAAIAVPTPAAATTVCTTAADGDEDTEGIQCPSGSEFSGNVRAELHSSSEAFFDSSIIDIRCDTSLLTGDVQADGDPADVNTAVFDDSSTGGSSECPVDQGGTATNSPQLPWDTGVVTWEQDEANDGLRNGTFRIDNVDVDITYGFLTCSYVGGGSIQDDVIVDLYNPNDPDRPLSDSAAQAVADQEDLDSTSSFPCPGSAEFSGVYVLHGESSPGVFDVDLWLRE